MKVRLMANDYTAQTKLVKAIRKNTPYPVVGVLDTSGTHGHTDYVEIDLTDIVVLTHRRFQP
jgi:hypothetical protein